MKYCLYLLVMVIALTGCDNESIDTSKSSYNQGIDLAIQGKFEKAESAFTSALNDEKDKQAAQQSLAVLKKALSGKLKKEATINFFEGVRYSNEGQRELAYSYFSKAIKAVPDFSSAYFERGIVNGRLNLYPQAVSDFTKAIDLNPQDAAAFNNRGLAYARGLKQYEKAIDDFTKAVVLDPDFAEAYDNRAIAYQIGNDDKKKACADWKKACDLGRCNSLNRARQNGYCT